MALSPSRRSENDCLFPIPPVTLSDLDERATPEQYELMCKWAAAVDSLRAKHCSVMKCDQDSHLLKIDKRFAGGQNAAYMSISYIDRSRELHNIQTPAFDLDAVARHFAAQDTRDVARSRPSVRRPMLVDGITVYLIAHIIESERRKLPVRPITTPALLVSEIITIISAIKWHSFAGWVPIVVRYCDEGCVFFPLYARCSYSESSVEVSDNQEAALHRIAMQAVSNACAAALRGNTREHRVFITGATDQETVFITRSIRAKLYKISANVYARRQEDSIITICFSVGLPYEFDIANSITNNIIDREVMYASDSPCMLTGHFGKCLNNYNVCSDTHVDEQGVLLPYVIDTCGDTQRDTQMDVFDLVMRDITKTST